MGGRETYTCVNKKRLYQYIEIFLLLKTVSFSTSHSVHVEHSKRLRRDKMERKDSDGHEVLVGVVTEIFRTI